MDGEDGRSNGRRPPLKVGSGQVLLAQHPDVVDEYLRSRYDEDGRRTDAEREVKMERMQSDRAERMARFDARRKAAALREWAGDMAEAADERDVERLVQLVNWSERAREWADDVLNALRGATEEGATS